jgi:uncharacterized protein with GYD domain
MIWGYTAIVDEQKQGLQKYLLLLKQSNLPIEKKSADDITYNRLENMYLEMGITMEDSYYLHGEYDWAIIFTTDDLRNAKKFTDILIRNYPGIITKFSLIRILYAQREHHIKNPDPSKLTEMR